MTGQLKKKRAVPEEIRVKYSTSLIQNKIFDVDITHKELDRMAV